MYAFQQYGVVPHIAQEAIQVQTILSLVESGLGLAIVPKVACRQAGSGVRLVNVPQLAETIKVGIALAVHPDNATPTTANFVDMACRLMQTEPAAGRGALSPDRYSCWILASLAMRRIMDAKLRRAGTPPGYRGRRRRARRLIAP